MSKDALAYPNLIFPTILSLRERGGSATVQQIDSDVAGIMELSNEVLAIPHGRGPRTEFQYRLAWVRTYLRIAGAATNPSKATWSLTDYGNAIGEEEAADIYRRVQAMRRRSTLHLDWDALVSVPEANDRLESEETASGGSQRPATFRFAIKQGKLTAEPFKADIAEVEAAALYAQLQRSARDLLAAASSTNSPMAALVRARTEDLLAALGNSPDSLAAGDLLALWSTFDSFVALLGTDEGVAETSLAVRHLAIEVLQRLSTLAALSARVREIVAYRNAIALSEEQAEKFDQLQSALADMAALPIFADIIDRSVNEAFDLHEARKRVAEATAENTSDIDAQAQAQRDALDIRKLQALDTSNFAAGLAEGVAGTNAKADEETRTAWARFKGRIAARFPEEMADAVIDVSASTIRSAPSLAFAVFGMMASPVFGALAGLAPALFRGNAKRLRDSLPEGD